MSGIQKIGIIGAGAMGQGIAQIAAQANLHVFLFDVSAAAISKAQAQLTSIWERQVERGRMSVEQVKAAQAQITPCAALEELADVDLVVEAIVENLEVKQDVFKRLEAVVSASCILASNTSSLSITAIAQACEHPERVAGFHFFNPVPLMKVVEVIEGLRTKPEVCQALVEVAQRMGHAPVRAKDMPGFIVNHAGRPMNIEGLKIAQEQVTDFATVDAIMREQAGFRMGPFELLDLTALDVSHPVMESIYHQFYEEPRFRPSPITAVRYAGGMYGRKTGQGFYTYVDGKKQLPEPMPIPPLNDEIKVWVLPHHEAGYERATELLERLGIVIDESDLAPEDALILITPYGEDVATVVANFGLDAQRTIALDTAFGLEAGQRRVLMRSLLTAEEWCHKALALFSHDQTPVSLIEDSAGFVAQRLVASIVNGACDIAQQGIATPADIDTAVSLGLGYPHGGPLSLGDAVGADLVLEILQSMQHVTGDMRYRPSLWLQRRVQLTTSLRTTR
ncbi:3-hydroxyacyl-CoA dehydrogenase [Paenalcaligenes hominis]|uniref:3-hydroxyacyl-CoA dehydrogenase n=1 Tax=Paenalcaligenes hominis TaxID=643674 RepID=UPI0035247E3F